MKTYKYFIFDMDGTLLDSMSLWHNLGEYYLKSKGIQAPDNLIRIINSMSVTESAEYFQNFFGISDSVEMIMADIYQLIERQYFFEIPLKPFASEYLEKLKKEGGKMCVATTTSRYLSEAALKRVGILPYFEFIVDCDEIGIGKHDPDIYFVAADRLGVDYRQIEVYEDADYAMATSKKAGFHTVGVYDASSKLPPEEMKKLCHKYVTSFEELLF